MAEINFGTVAYILGILSIVFAFVSPAAGLILGIVGLVQNKKQKAERTRKLNMIGIILSIIFIVISIILTIFFTKSGLNSGSFPLF